MNAKYPNHVIICNFADAEEISKIKEYEGIEIRKSIVMEKSKYWLIHIDDFMTMDVTSKVPFKTL
jgi:hypothetical protein